MQPEALGLRMWAILIGACGVASIPFLLAGFSFEPNFLLIFLEGPAIGFVSVRLLKRYPAAYAFAGAVEGIFWMTFAGLFGLLLCYAAAAGGAPLVDRQLLQIDRLLGYDWQSYARFCAQYPALLQGYRIAYSTILTQPALIGAVLLLAKREIRFEKFVLANLIGSAITATLFLLCPATTAWTSQGQEASANHILSDLPIIANSWLGDLMQIRGGSGRTLTRVAGIVAFPSFHCVSAILNTWAVWPVRIMRWPFLLLNLAMIAATPLIGGHYLVDLIGGAAVVLVTIPLSHPLHMWLCRMPMLPFANLGVPGLATRELA